MLDGYMIEDATGAYMRLLAIYCYRSHCSNIILHLSTNLTSSKSRVLKRCPICNHRIIAHVKVYGPKLKSLPGRDAHCSSHLRRVRFLDLEPLSFELA